MSFEPIGAITIIVGLLCLTFGAHSTVIAFVAFCTLGSAAAFLIGGANIQPAHLFLIFLAVSTLFWRKFSTLILQSLRITEPGFWLLCLVFYGVLSSYVMPRLFAGTTYIVPLGTSSYSTNSDGVVPLGPVSSNVTQPIYLIGDLVCFVIIAGVGSSRSGMETIAKALMAYATVNIAFGFLDLITSATGTADLLSFIRNAQYTFHDEESVGDLRRIIGSWPEASAFANATLGAFGFTGMMWLCGRQPLLNGLLALMSLMFIVFSTSSTGLVGAVAILAILYMAAAWRCSTAWQDRFSAAAFIAGPLLLGLLIMIIVSSDAASTKVYDYLDTLVLSKSTSDSGMQRSAWNAQGWRNFLETWGLGVGLGTNRTSSFPLALLSNLGVPGVAFYLMFIVSVFGARQGIPRSYRNDIRSAAQIGCISLLVGSVLSGPSIDQTLLFYVLAGLASATPGRDRCATSESDQLLLNDGDIP